MKKQSILLNPKILVAVILVQTLTLIAVYINRPGMQNKMTTQVLSESIADQDKEYRECLQMPISDRPTCAKMIGIKLSKENIDLNEKVRQCMKLRPIFVRFCLEELRKSL